MKKKVADMIHQNYYYIRVASQLIINEIKQMVNKYLVKKIKYE